MSIWQWLGINVAYAATSTTAATGSAQHPSEGGFLPMILFLVAILGLFYFTIVRPQSKRAKEQRTLLKDLSAGDEVVTAGGIVGKIVKLEEQYVVLSLNKGVEIVMQKNSISQMLPKGTIDSIGRVGSVAK